MKEEESLKDFIESFNQRLKIANDIYKNKQRVLKTTKIKKSFSQNNLTSKTNTLSKNSNIFSPISPKTKIKFLKITPKDFFKKIPWIPGHGASDYLGKFQILKSRPDISLWDNVKLNL